MQKIVNACDFSYFCSIAAPDAPEDRLRTMCDWGNWVSFDGQLVSNFHGTLSCYEDLSVTDTLTQVFPFDDSMFLYS